MSQEPGVVIFGREHDLMSGGAFEIAFDHGRMRHDCRGVQAADAPGLAGKQAKAYQTGPVGGRGDGD